MRSIIPTLLFLLGVALAFRIDLYFTIVWFLIGLYVLSRVWARKAAQGLRVARTYPERAFNGDRITVALTLQNESRLPVPWIEVEESTPVELRDSAVPAQAMALGGHSRRGWSYTLICRQRGYYRLGPLRMQTGDLLGIEQRILLLQEVRHLTVYPRIVSLDRLGLPTRSALTTLPSRTPLFDDATRIMGVRDYQAGDSPRRIHWPATARAGNLLVKQYQPAIARDTHICLDLALRDYELRERHAATEMAITTAASLAHHIIIHEGLPAGLAVLGALPPGEGDSRTSPANTKPADSPAPAGGLRSGTPHDLGSASWPQPPEPACITFPPRSERSQLIQMLETLARVAVTTEGDFPARLRQESLHLAWGSTILAIVGQIEAPLAQTLLYLKRTGHAVGLILVRPGKLQPHERAGLPGVPIHQVWTDFDLGALT